MSENIDFCEVCLDDRAYTIKEEETIEYARGKEIKYIKKQAYCTECHNPMYIGKINDENLEVLYSKIREVDNIINIEQIKKILYMNFIFSIYINFRKIIYNTHST